MIAILYSEGCAPCRSKALWKRLKDKCANKRIILARKDVAKDLIARDEANNKYGRSVPFIVLDGVDMSVEEFLNA